MSPTGEIFPRDTTLISLSIAAFVSEDCTKLFMNVREGVARKGLEEGEGGERERGTRQLDVNIGVYCLRDSKRGGRFKEYLPIWPCKASMQEYMQSEESLARATIPFSVVGEKIVKTGPGRTSDSLPMLFVRRSSLQDGGAEGKCSFWFGHPRPQQHRNLLKKGLQVSLGFDVSWEC